MKKGAAITALPQTPTEIQAALEQIRTERKPTRRGIMLCGATMYDMLRQGWHKDDLDALEILWWSIHDGNGELLPPTSIHSGLKRCSASGVSAKPRDAVGEEEEDLGERGAV